jgi:hypothetical protein
VDIFGWLEGDDDIEESPASKPWLYDWRIKHDAAAASQHAVQASVTHRRHCCIALHAVYALESVHLPWNHGTRVLEYTCPTVRTLGYVFHDEATDFPLIF